MMDNTRFNINSQCFSKSIFVSSFRGWQTIKILTLILFATTNLSAYEAVLSNSNGLSNVNFTGWTGDYFMQVFVPPADGYVNSMDFYFSDLPDTSGGGISIWIYEPNYPWDEINTEEIADEAPQSHLGYYDADTALYPIGDNWVFGGINNVAGAVSDYAYDPLGEQVWPAFGSGSMSIEPNSDDGGLIRYTPVTFSQYQFLANEPFIVVVRFNGFPDEGTDNEAYRMGFTSGTQHRDPQPCAKFYNTNSSPEGRSGTNDWGWHIRSYVWEWAINVELFSSPRPLVIDVESLGTTVSTEDRTVTAIIYDHSPSGQETIDSVSLWYTVDGSASIAVPMLGEDSLYTAVIPGQDPGSVIQYWVEVTDILGDTYDSSPHSYTIFQPTHPTLVVFNGGATTGFPYEDYFGPAVFPHDVWDGEIIPELAAEYTAIYEIAHFGNGPAFDNREVISDWLETGEKNYCLAGDENFGSWTNWADQDYAPGDFEYDILGVSHIYNDISAFSAAVTPVEAVPGNFLSDSLYIIHMAAGDTLMYDPVYEVGGLNWLDGFDLVDPGSANMVTFADGMPIGLDRISGDDKIVLFGFDPISINASPYEWYG
ncbi:MAG: hypothetical protein HQ556_13600, partial [Candidatus Marinimicrobia bacterium]|nr:hypothetical protein [Candidatus Neomarinimicrobiota bacterium]